MKQISESDYRLIVEKLPVVLAAVRCSPDDHVTVNARRRLILLARKLAPKKKQNQSLTHKQKMK